MIDKMSWIDYHVYLTMRHHERGEDIIMSSFMGDDMHYMYEDVATGVRYDASLSKTSAKYREYKIVSKLPVRWAYDGVHSFTWAAPLVADAIYDPIKRNLVANHEQPNDTTLTGYTGVRSYVRSLFYDHRNPINIIDGLYSSVNEFAWGTLDGGAEYREYMEQIRDMWLDWHDEHL